MAVLLASCSALSSSAQETICARVKIEIKQELTLERQAFDAEMKIFNTTDAGVIENVSVVVKVTDELGTPVPVSDNPNDTAARFFVRVSSLKDIGNVGGTGAVAAKTTGIANWLLIPAPASSGNTPAGKKYLVGATLKYRYLGEDTTLEVSPDVITVKPLPLLTLDYFLPTDVWADDPLTPEVEAVEPFTLGVRVRNNGVAVARNLKIDSAQPKIIENNQGLLIGFTLTGSYLDDTPALNSLLIDFGDIASGRNKMGRWVMETTLAGRFSEFTARYTHADELGGALTSLLQATNTHTLLRDVRVDLPGRDLVRDFLAQDADAIRVYESDSTGTTDSIVTNHSAAAAFTSVSTAGDVANYSLSFPPTTGFAYVKLVDPFNGTKQVGRIVRSDGKVLLPENVWFSKTRDKTTKQWSYFVNFFDVNTTGQYQAQFQPPAGGQQPPVLQLVADQVVTEGRQVSFLVEASSPDRKPLTLSAAPLPAGARFTQQAIDPGAPNLTRAIFDWTPSTGQAGTYLITYTASDGALSATRSASIKVDPAAAPTGPGTPSISAPLSGAQVATLRPTLAAQASTAAQDPTTQLQFELYSDEALTQLVASTQLPKAPPVGTTPQPTPWTLPADLQDNTRYWWRVRATDGTRFSLWADSRFFVNLFNDPPERFNLLLPAPGGEVADGQPTLSWANATDKDGDSITYTVQVYTDAALSQLVASVQGLAADPSGTTSWKVTPALALRKQHFWRVTATDTPGAQTVTSARSFYVGVGNAAPAAPAILNPAPGATVASKDVDLTVGRAIDPDGDLVTLVFELDTAPSFDTGAKRSSGQIIQGSGPSTSWRVTGLTENTRYHWRVKAQDGRAESAWVQGSFLVSVVNDPPSTPTVRNPGNGAWVATLQPTLEVTTSIDPEGSAVSYEFQLGRDPGFGSGTLASTTTSPSWTVNSVLSDKTTYHWRARAVDAEGARSEWTNPAVMYVSTGTYQDPTIQVTAPATLVSPTQQGTRKIVRIAWNGTDLNIEPTIALYHAPNQTAFSGTLITDGLRQSAGTQPGSYDWDVTSLAPGTYYVYAVIYDSRGVGRAWAPGAVIITPATQTGSVIVTPPANPQTTELGGQVRVAVRLGSAPTAEVTLPVATTRAGEGIAQPPSLSFTQQNWNVDQQVTVTGQFDCIPDGNRSYELRVGNAVSLDPQYSGIAAAPVTLTNQDNTPSWAVTSNNPNVRICALAIKRQTQINASTWEYELDAGFGNAGNAAAGGTARLTAVPALLTIVDAELTFGALQQGEAGRSLDTITIRSRGPLSAAYFQAGVGFRWTLTVR